MKVIVDTNIVYSAILSQSGKIGQMLLFGRKQFEFFAPNLVKTEVKRHQEKLMQTAEIDIDDFEDLRDDIFSCINFISEEQIPYDYWYAAIPVVRDIDMDDIAFVALAEFLDAQLWTGDKKLLKGLVNRGFLRGMTTEELYSLLQNIDNK